MRAAAIRLRTELLRAASEIEARLSHPNDTLRLRRWFLRTHGVEFGSPIWIGHGFRLLANARIVIGSRCAFGENASLVAWDIITIGDDFLCPGNLNVNSGTHDPLTLLPRNAPIAIGSRVWCGTNVTILAGVSIGDDVVIGAGSVVTRDIPANCVAVGVPAAPVKALARNPGAELWSWAARPRELSR